MVGVFGSAVFPASACDVEECSGMSTSVLTILPPGGQGLLGDAPLSPQGVAEPARWDLPELEGRLVEISGEGASAALTCAFGLVVEAQGRGENAAWISARRDGFFPPDAAAGGVDLGALPVVSTAGVLAAGRAASHLLRSGAFGLVVLDLGEGAELPAPLLSRLTGLAQRHGAVLLALTDKGGETPSLGSLVSLRAEARREELPGGGGFRCELVILKDKRRGPGARFVEVCHGPAGLR